MTFTALDYVLGIIILIFAFAALFKGFINELFGKASWILGILCGVLFYADLAPHLEEKIASGTIRNILAFIIIFVVVFLVLKIIGAIIGKIFEMKILNSLDHALGLFFGLIEGFAIAGFILFLISIQPFFDAKSLLDASFFYGIYVKVIASPEFKEVTTHV